MSLNTQASLQGIADNQSPRLAQLNSVLRPFQKCSTRRALVQVLNSIVLYVLLWFAIYWSWRFSFVPALGITLLAGLLVVRVFIIMHDCGHGSFTGSKLMNNIIGYVAGLMVFTPYYHWRWEHSIHHSTSGDLNRRGIGDIWTMTVQEYVESASWRRFLYAITRHPAVLMFIAPVLLFLFWNRIPSRNAGRRERLCVWTTNAWVVFVCATLPAVFGWRQFLITQLLITTVGGGIGIWLFYVQHQFEGAYWTRSTDWDYVASALRGSSFYRLPKVLQWFSGNIGFHHIHHLRPGIPNYNLERCHAAHPIFAQVPTVTLWSSFACARLKLWDEERQELVSFRFLKARRKSSCAKPANPPG